MDRPLPPEKRRPGDAGPALAAEQLQAELRRLRAENRTLVRLNRLQERFVAMASHEFKTPLTSITAYTDALLARTEEPEDGRAREFLAVIREEAARLLRMVNRILDFSRMEYGSRLLDRRPTDMAGLARETAQTLTASVAAKRQRLDVVAAPDLPPAEVDADLVRRCVRECSAAFDYVLIDAGASDSPLMRPLAEASHRAMLVVRLGRTQREQARTVWNGLQQAGLKLHGCIVTNRPASR